MKLTRRCADCKQDIRKEEMIQYSTLSGKTTYWLCKDCYEKRLDRERFSNKVCEIFGIKSPGPRIWTERKRLQDTYGYTDNTIIDCLDYIYNIEKRNALYESLCLVKPASVERMKKWKTTHNGRIGSLVAAAANTKIETHYVPIRENVSTIQPLNPNDFLDDE